MNQFLAILNDVMRIATFQWHGERRHGHDCNRYGFAHHEAWTERHPIRRCTP
jgi:hypothetical protein